MRPEILMKLDLLASSFKLCTFSSTWCSRMLSLKVSANGGTRYNMSPNLLTGTHTVLFVNDNTTSAEYIPYIKV